MTVATVGDASGIADVTLGLDGERTTTTVTIDPGETKAITLAAAVPEAAGEYDVTFETADDAVTTTLVVESADDTDAKSDEDEEMDDRDARWDRAARRVVLTSAARIERVQWCLAQTLWVAINPVCDTLISVTPLPPVIAIA